MKEVFNVNLIGAKEYNIWVCDFQKKTLARGTETNYD